MPLHHHDYVIPISEHEILWRYMNLCKFNSLLDRRQLFFCRADKFNDGFEFTMPKKEYEFQEKDARKKLVDHQKAVQKVNKLIGFMNMIRKSIVVNCWHIDEVESVIMWEKFLHGGPGIVIKSNLNKIKRALNQTLELIYLSKVRYINYNNDSWYNHQDFQINSLNTITPIIHKRIKYQPELEARMFIQVKEATHDFSDKFWGKQEYLNGVFIDVNLDELIDVVIYSPKIDCNEKKLMVEKVKKLGYTFDFRDSDLSF